MFVSLKMKWYSGELDSIDQSGSSIKNPFSLKIVRRVIFNEHVVSNRRVVRVCITECNFAKILEKKNNL